MPENARSDERGFRMYDWPGGSSDLHRLYGATEPATVISVTAARSVVGIAYQLQTWQINNVVNLATGQRRAEWRDYSKSKRGRLVKGYKKDGPFPGEFVGRMLATEGDEDKLNAVREWLKATADEPRDVAAVRGSVVHKLIEMRVPMSAISEDIIRWYFDQQWEQEKRKVLPTVTDEDVDFVGNALANYWDMREAVPFVIIAQEPQVWNLRAGYAGSADVLVWFLPPSQASKQAHWQEQATRGLLTLETIQGVGGTIALGDWKTSPDVYCVEASTPVLTDDLRWVPAHTLKPGDGLWAFTDERVALGKKGRRWTRSVVERNELKEAETVAITMESGRIIVCTPDHPLLARRSSGGRRMTEGGTIWVEAMNLRPGDTLPRYLDVWGEDQGREAGWFAGLLDGEGCLSKGGRALSFAQKEGVVAERARAFMRSRGWTWTEDVHTNAIQFNIHGGVAEVAAILGSIRPSRLLPKFNPGDLQSSIAKRDRVVSVAPTHSRGRIASLTTSSGTFFSDGYGSHNTGHVVQGTAYLAATFVGRNGEIDARLTEILRAALHGLIIKIRPDGWEVDTFEYREDVSLAFFGEVALARFLLTHEKPGALFSETISGQAPKEWR